MKIGIKEKYVLIIDEFQEFFKINSSVYSSIQELYDQYRYDSKVCILFLGSVNCLMNKIFLSYKEPLFGRCDEIINLKSFPPSIIKKILDDNKMLTNETFFYYYLITGGVPLYINKLIDLKAKSFDDIVNIIFTEDSYFIKEGKFSLISEFGSDYTTYFSILSLISSGKTSKNEIESVINVNISSYLDRLENYYGFIKKYRPINSKISGKIVKYKIDDNFLNFYFSFIFSSSQAIEIGNFEYVKTLVYKRISTYAGFILERLYTQILIEKQEYNKIGSYWEKNHKNEIDIIAINDCDKKMLTVECKMNKEKASLNKLKEKSQSFIKKYCDYNIDYKILSYSDLLIS